MSDLFPLSRIDFERIPYWDEERWDDEGEKIYDGTCLPIEAHVLELRDWYDGPSTRIICPEADLGGCSLLDSGKRQGCFVDDWYSNAGNEMLDDGLLKILLKIRVGEYHEDDGFTIVPVDVLSWSSNEK